MKRRRHIKRRTGPKFTVKPKQHPRRKKSIEKSKKPSISFLSKLDHVNGGTCYIVGGGPSLKKFDFSVLDGHDVIAVNSSIKFIKNPKYFITMDYTFFKKNVMSIEAINNKVLKSYFIANMLHSYMKVQDGQIVDTRNNYIYESVNKFTGVINSTSISKFNKKLSGFSHGHNSGFCAIQFAILQGYTKIYLLGFDMITSNNSTHFHNEYKNLNRKLFSQNLIKYKEILDISINEYDGPSEIVNITPEHPEFNNIKPKPIEKVKMSTDLSDLMIVAYYTLNTPYEQEAEKLRRSLDRLNLQYDLLGVKNLGNWQANTRFKAEFMLDMLDKHKGKNLLYVDVDAIIHAPPVLFKNYNCDIAVRWQDFRWRKQECLSGTIYMANNDKTRKLCKIWRDTNTKEGSQTKRLEQWNLGNAIEQMKKSDGLIDKNLPPEYTFIFDIMKKIYPNAKPIIEHFQASRRFRNRV